jgi:hypothetical protein
VSPPRGVTHRLDLRLLLLGVLLIVGVNAVVLAGAAWNRSGEPDALLWLSERELALPWRSADRRDNSGLALDLRWRVATADSSEAPTHMYHGHAVDWLDADALRALGFDIPQSGVIDEKLRRRWLPRMAWLVLEIGGDAHARAVAGAQAQHDEAVARQVALPDDRESRDRLQQALTRLQQERDEHSRLFVIDGGPDPDRLRARYADRDRYLILRGRVVPVAVSEASTARTLRGRIEAIDITRVHVPARFHAVFPGHFDSDAAGHAAARHEVALATGKRREPWITEARAR